LETSQPCLFVKKNTSNIISSSVINFSGSSFSTVVILSPSDTIKITYIQYSYNAANILQGQYVTRITYTQLDLLKGEIGSTGPTGAAPRILSGTDTTSASTKSVTFSPSFVSAPIVTATAVNTDGTYITLNSITNSGFNAKAFAGSGDTQFNWTAIL
jgi:hypothetical protein